METCVLVPTCRESLSFYCTQQSPPGHMLRTDSPKNQVHQHHLKDAPPSRSSFPSLAASYFVWFSSLCPIDKKNKNNLWVYLHKPNDTFSYITDFELNVKPCDIQWWQPLVHVLQTTRVCDQACSGSVVSSSQGHLHHSWVKKSPSVASGFSQRWKV